MTNFQRIFKILLDRRMSFLNARRLVRIKSNILFDHFELQNKPFSHIVLKSNPFIYCLTEKTQ